MALIPCPECATQVSERAPACPKCGVPIAGARSQSGAGSAGDRLSPPSGEVTYYTDQLGVRVTNSRAMFGSKTYSMANVSSVNLLVERPSYAGAVAMILIGLVSGLTCISNKGMGGGSVLGFLIMLAGIAWAVRLKPFYWVRITASSGESNVWKSKHKGYIEEIVAALNESIVHRG